MQKLKINTRVQQRDITDKDLSSIKVRHCTKKDEFFKIKFCTSRTSKDAETVEVHLGQCRVGKVAVIDALSLGTART